MTENQKFLIHCPLFRGVNETDIEQILQELGAEYKNYEKGELLYRTGDRINYLGIVLTGGLHIIKEDFWGNRNIIARLGRGEIFGETYACLKMEESGVDVEASELSQILFVNINKIMDGTSNIISNENGISAHGSFNNHLKLLVYNLLRVLAGKNLFLTGKLGHVMQRSTREKLLSYLSEQSRIFHSSEFKIPFNRQQLADYLSVDRSAMSHELSRLKKEKVLEFNKNYFHLMDKM